MFIHSDLLKLHLEKNGISLSFPDKTVIFVKNPCCKLMRYKYRELLTNHILIYRRLKYVKPEKYLRTFGYKNAVMMMGPTEQSYYSIFHSLVRLFILKVLFNSILNVVNKEVFTC